MHSMQQYPIVTYYAGFNCDSWKDECVEKGLWKILHMLQED
jgi:hypothetical protein